MIAGAVVEEARSSVTCCRVVHTFKETNQKEKRKKGNKSMNKVILMGRLTRDPEVRYSQGEQPMAIARFSLAVDRRQKTNSADGQSADFINCVAFGKTGEFVEKYLRKGTKIALTGRIQTGSYTNKDGAKVYTTDIVAEDIEFAESKNSANREEAGGFTTAAPQSTFTSSGDGFMNIPDGIDEELPFN